MKTYDPKGSRPTTVLALAKADGALEGLAILELTPGETSVRIKSISLSTIAAGNLDTLAKIADASGVRPTIMQDAATEAREAQDLR